MRGQGVEAEDEDNRGISQTSILGDGGLAARAMMGLAIAGVVCFGLASVLSGKAGGHPSRGRDQPAPPSRSRVQVKYFVSFVSSVHVHQHRLHNRHLLESGVVGGA